MTLIHPSLKMSLAAVLVAGLPVAATAGEDNLSPLWFSLDLGAGMGLTQDNYQQQADDAGLDVTLNNANAPRLAWKIGAGWNLWQAPETPFTLATQLEWFDLGQVDLSYSGSVNQSQLENLYDELKSIHPESGNGLALGFSGQWQGLGQDKFRALGLGAELGATYWWQTYDLNGVEGDVVRTDDSSGAGWYAGLLSDYALTPQWKLRGGWRVYGLDSETVQAFTLGFSYRMKALHRGAPQTDGEESPQAEPTVETTPSPAPIGIPDRYTLDQGGSRALDLLANDSDPAGLPLHIVWVEGASAGALQINEGRQSVQYTHPGGNGTSDSFRYWLSNDKVEIGPVMVELSILPTSLAEPVRFENGSSQIPPPAATRLNRLAQWLKENPGAALVISGHSDSAGDLERNRVLSEQRAQTVRSYLIEQGIAPARLSAIGHGQTHPLADNDSATGRALNRRVEIQLEH